MAATISSPSQLRSMVRGAYSSAAEQPGKKHAFPVGRQFAESIGYPAEVLDTLPCAACEAFAGVSNVSLFADLPPGTTVLDLGCGSGTDTLIAAGRVGPTGKVIGVDFSEPMLARARQAVRESGASNVELREADAERLPIEDGEIDVAIVNGIFNLNPARDAIFRELARVIRPSGSVYAAELILSQPLPRRPAPARAIGLRESQAQRKEMPSWVSSEEPGSPMPGFFEWAAMPAPRIRLCLRPRYSRGGNLGDQKASWGLLGPSFLPRSDVSLLGEGCSYVARCCVVCHAEPAGAFSEDTECDPRFCHCQR